MGIYHPMYTPREAGGAYTPPYVHTQGGREGHIHHPMYTPKEASRHIYHPIYTPREARRL